MSRRNDIGYDVLNDLINSGQLVADQEKHRFVLQDPSRPLQLSGNGNYGPRQAFADKLFAMTDEEFSRETEQFIWLSAYAANNYNSDYHWQCDTCYNEATRRGNPELYNQAWERARRS